jgi:hypothetical protein
MRDLRLWVEENAPFSSRAKQYKAEIYQINTELNYLQHRAFLRGILIWLGIAIGWCYWGPQHWKGAIQIQNRPV